MHQHQHHITHTTTTQDPADDGADFLLKDDGDDIDLRLARLEALTGRWVCDYDACVSCARVCVTSREPAVHQSICRIQPPPTATDSTYLQSRTPNRRPELLSAVMLRQNPHNVAEWHKRVKLFEANPTKQVGFYDWLVAVGGGWLLAVGRWV
jgi:pre-mRNA-splicing factor SYF1